MDGTHVSEERLVAFGFEGATPAADEAAHLSSCAACAGRAAALRTLAAGMAIAAHSRPSAEAVARAQALAALLPSRTPLARAAWMRAAVWMRATLAVDTRRMAGAGVRSLAGGYRLLYATDAAEIELRVEAENGGRRIDGELLALDARAQGPALVQLVSESGVTVAESEAGSDGRFGFRHVAPGVHWLWVGLAGGDDLLIEALEIA